jgi:hypothetical protein
MNESIKTFSLIIITICVFIMTVIDVLKLVDERKNPGEVYSGVPPEQAHSPIPPAEATNMPETSMHFDQTKFDFGEMNQGDVVHHSFSFTNTGSNPLLITNAVGSCGCTVPTYPKEPIAPGGKGTIEVQFNSAGKKDMQDKTVTLTANTDPPGTVLSIHANVHAKE